MDLKLRKFNMKNIAEDKVVVLIGKRETGKSFLVKDLLYHHQNVPIGTVISGTEGANCFYGKIIPKVFIYEDYTPEIIFNFLKRQKLIKKQIKKQEKYGKKTSDPRAFLILDDCLYDSSWTKDKNVRSLFMNGRHYNVLFLITMQFALGIPPNLRTNVDFIFILRETIVSNRKRLYDHWAGMFPSFEIFCQVMNQCTEDFHCLVINNNAKSNKLEDQVFWYKAKPHNPFKLCNKRFWKIKKKHNNTDNDSSSDDDFDINSYKKKKGPRINVVRKKWE